MIALFAAADARQLTPALKALRFSNSDVKWIAAIVTSWHQISSELKHAMLQDSPPPDAALRRWAAIAGRTRFASVLRLADVYWCAEREAGNSAPANERIASVYRRALRIAYRDPIEVADLAIGGSDLGGGLFFGLPEPRGEHVAGGDGGVRPAVGRTLRNLLQKVISDPAVNHRDRLLALAASEATEGAQVGASRSRGHDDT